MERHGGRDKGQPEIATGTSPSTEKVGKKVTLGRQTGEQQTAALETPPRLTAKLGEAGSRTPV